MSRAARWLRSLWSGAKERKTGGREEGFEKKRWSFKKCSRENSGIAAWPDSDAGCVEDQSKRAIAVAVATAAAANAAVAAARAAAAAVRFGPHRSGAGLGCGLARSAAVRIQAAFRGYLARRALRALRGMVKLQALVRGDLARKQAAIRALERRTDDSRQVPARISIPSRHRRNGENLRSPALAGNSTPKSCVADSQSPKYMASTQSSAAKRWVQPRRRPLGEINAEVKKADVGGGLGEACEFKRAVVGRLERSPSEHFPRK